MILLVNINLLSSRAITLISVVRSGSVETDTESYVSSFVQFPNPVQFPNLDFDWIRLYLGSC
jgi:hypothetical protein